MGLWHWVTLFAPSFAPGAALQPQSVPAGCVLVAQPEGVVQGQLGPSTGPFLVALLPTAVWGPLYCGMPRTPRPLCPGQPWLVRVGGHQLPMDPHLSAVGGRQPSPCLPLCLFLDPALGRRMRQQGAVLEGGCGPCQGSCSELGGYRKLLEQPPALSPPGWQAQGQPRSAGMD